ncbi:MAG TPA: TrmH family RNA methyltransferase [Methylocella sp.]|nr:TrmH family RNA methyltransferase [Methylocella sp.]
MIGSLVAKRQAAQPQAAPFTVALYQPDIPQNTGTILRMCACLGLSAAIIEPAGFPASDKHFRRAGLDYLDHLEIAYHADWAAFEGWRRAAGRRLILLTTKAKLAYTNFRFGHGDILLLGRESAGVLPEVHQAADTRLLIPIKAPLRSLNVAVAAAMVAGEALRQLAS